MPKDYDVIVAGGGPAGSTAAIILRRAGLRVALFEKDAHPRFHIGESILPRTTPLLKELGLHDAVTKLPHVPKFGAEFGFGNDPKTRRFSFRDGLLPGFPVFNIERAELDKCLLDQARAVGVEVFESTPVKAIKNLDQGDVQIEAGGRSLKASLLLDATGQGAMLGRYLKTRKTFDEPELQKVAYFQHFEGVERLSGEERGHPGIFMCDEGWFWIIGLNETRTSVGFVTRPQVVRTLGVPPDRLLKWAICRCPNVRHRMRNATGPSVNEVLADFSYRCNPPAGPGYFLLGDAAAFLDPIFSTGVTLAMMSAREAAQLSIGMLRGEVNPASAQDAYRKFLTRTTSPFWRLIRAYYTQPFRELIINGDGPLQMSGAIISILAGQVFPQPPWSLRWRHRLFDVCCWLQKHFALAPHRPVFKLAAEPPIDMPLLSGPSTLHAPARPSASVPTQEPASAVS
ncbi:MAG: NAD(P)/FAD-dependent oxidoreductase [Phycisphaerales bacterium]